jgi:L-fucose isomerase-like protein
MEERKTNFAVLVGNRGFFPASLISEAREEIPTLLREWGHGVVMLPEEATRCGAVETPREGEIFADLLNANMDSCGGIIISLPNFGDETGAVTAVRKAGIPILIQAYPDELDKMAPELRRDAFCGKLSIMDVLRQYGVRFTALKPHVVSPKDPRFKDNVDYFDRVCRVVGGMRDTVVGAIGARTTPFKTVRIDEITLQSHGITVETYDLSGVIERVRKMPSDSEEVSAKSRVLRDCASWESVPGEAFENIAKLGVAIDEIIAEGNLDAVALRCWLELQEQLGISPCVLLGELNERGIPAACEVDIGSAVTMRALSLASGSPATCLDWNNNYMDEDDKCILFHCGPVPKSLMKQKGRITDHAILCNSVGEGRSYGPCRGNIEPMEFTFGNMATDAGKVKFYLGEGRITDDSIPDDFFGCAGVAEIEGLQDVLLHIGREGHRHHVAITPGRVLKPLREALKGYLNLEVVVPQERT